MLLLLAVPSFKSIFSAITVVSEIGANMDVFPTAPSLGSYPGALADALLGLDGADVHLRQGAAQQTRHLHLRDADRLRDLDLGPLEPEAQRQQLAVARLETGAEPVDRAAGLGPGEAVVLMAEHLAELGQLASAGGLHRERMRGGE